MIRNILAVCGLLGAIVVSAAIANVLDGAQAPVMEEREIPDERLLATDSFELESGLVVVEMTHQGEGDFAVNMLPAEQETTAPAPVEFSGDKNGGSDADVAFVLADKTGPVDISRAIKVPAVGEYVFEVRADGPWTLRAEQPQPSSAAERTSFGGEDDTATPLFRLSSGPKNVTVSNPNRGDLQVSLLDEDGNVVAPAIGAEPGRYPPDEASSTINIPRDGAYLFDVRADNLWAVEIVG